MGTINFLPDDDGGNKRSRRSGRASVEYTSGNEEQIEPTTEVAPQAPSPAVPVMKKKSKKEKAPKQPSAFSAWRATRKAKKEQVNAAKPLDVSKLQKLEAQKKQAHKKADHSFMHDAPRHEKEAIAPDILHDETSFMVPEDEESQQQYSQAPAPKPQSKTQAPVAQKPETQKRKSRVHAAPNGKKVFSSFTQPQTEAPSSTSDTSPLDALGVNLLPRFRNGKEKRSKKKDGVQHPGRNLIMIATVTIVLVLGAYGGMRVYEQRLVQSTSDIEQQITQIDQQIFSYTAVRDESRVVGEQLDSIAEVLDTHIYWTPFLETLESLTLSTISYTQMDGSAATGVFVFDSLALTYADIDAQISVFEHASEVESVEVTSTVRAQSGEEADAAEPIRFIMTVEFNQSVFHPTQVAKETEKK